MRILMALLMAMPIFMGSAAFAHDGSRIDQTRVPGRWIVERVDARSDKSISRCEVVFTLQASASGLDWVISDPRSCMARIMGSPVSGWGVDYDSLSIYATSPRSSVTMEFDRASMIRGVGYDVRNGVRMRRPDDIRGSDRSIDYSVRYMLEALDRQPGRDIRPGRWIMSRAGMTCPIELTTRPYHHLIAFAVVDSKGCTTRIMGGKAYMWSLQGDGYRDTSIVFDPSAPGADEVKRDARDTGREKAVLIKPGNDRPISFKADFDFETNEGRGRWLKAHEPHRPGRWERMMDAVTAWWRDLW